MNHKEILSTAIGIAEEYRDDYGLVLTLRQMYYQFVARGYLENGTRTYKNLGALLTRARLNGGFPIEYLEDRGRTVGKTSAAEILSVEEGVGAVGQSLARMPYWLYYGRWHGQPIKVSVWIEKEALAGVLEDTCKNLGVGLFPCKGYPSISALAEWVNATYDLIEEGEEAVILYLGDHDPDGLQIPISAEETIRQIMEVQGKTFDFTMKRIALTRAQIRKHNPPPMVAKKTSARYAAYKKKTGLDDAWELDALNPPVLQKLVKDHVARLFDPSIHHANLTVTKAMRTDMIERVCEDPDWVEDQMRKNL